jgi:hypothetical protein
MEDYVVPAIQSSDSDLLIVELDDRLEFSVISPTNMCASPADTNVNCGGTACNNYQCGS